MIKKIWDSQYVKIGVLMIIVVGIYSAFNIRSDRAAKERYYNTAEEICQSYNIEITDHEYMKNPRRGAMKYYLSLTCTSDSDISYEEIYDCMKEIYDAQTNVVLPYPEFYLNGNTYEEDNHTLKENSEVVYTAE